MRGRDSFIGRALAAAFATPAPESVDGFAMKRGAEDAVEAAVEFRGRLEHRPVWRPSPTQRGATDGMLYEGATFRPRPGSNAPAVARSNSGDRAELAGALQGRFIVAVPRLLLPRLFGGLRGAENELAAALGMLALYACSQVLRAKHETASGVVFSEPELGPAGAPTDGEVVIPIGGSWLAANLLDADAIGGVS